MVADSIENCNQIPIADSGSKLLELPIVLQHLHLCRATCDSTVVQCSSCCCNKDWPHDKDQQQQHGSRFECKDHKDCIQGIRVWHQQLQQQSMDHVSAEVMMVVDKDQYKLLDNCRSNPLKVFKGR